MRKQLSRIESFVENLVNNEFTNGQQSMILSADFNVIGGDNKRCENRGSDACASTNGTCTNVGTCRGDNTRKCGNMATGFQPAPNTQC